MSNLHANFAVEDELYLWLMLAHTPKIGSYTALKLLQHFGSIQNIYEQSTATLAQIINPTIAQLITERAAEKAVDDALNWLNPQSEQHIISLASANYPEELAQIADPPLILFLHGNIKQLQQQKFAIVGSRNPSVQGVQNATKLAQELANNGLTIVSGMALGIDKAAHMGAIKGRNSTIGVIGTGIDQRYPKSNHDLYDQVLAKDGLIISELPLRTSPLPGNFPRRNRIIAGLCRGLLVVESALDGGSMLTANLALEMGRDVMAIPGSIHNPTARGCHKLIKNGAKLVENSNDIFEELSLDFAQIKYNAAHQGEENDPFLNRIGYEPLTIDAICANLNMPFTEVCTTLLKLELAGKIVNCGGGLYQRLVS